jgi:DNA-binding NtrC family response regulator
VKDLGELVRQRGARRGRTGAVYNPPPTIAISSFRTAKSWFERNYFSTVLKACGGNVSQAARVAGLDRRNFYAHINKLGVKPRRRNDNHEDPINGVT